MTMKWRMLLLRLGAIAAKVSEYNNAACRGFGCMRLEQAPKRGAHIHAFAHSCTARKVAMRRGTMNHILGGMVISGRRRGEASRVDR
jgi:hypothetical protein